MKTQTPQTPAPASRFTEKRWDHPSLWKGVKQGICTACKNGPHILREGLCWTCEQENSATADIN